MWTTTQAAGLWHRSLSLQCTCRCRLGTSYEKLTHKLVKVASSHQLLLLVFSASCPHVGRGAGKNTITAVTAVLIRNCLWFCKSSIEKVRKLKTFSINVHSHENTVLLTSRLWSREEKTPGNRKVNTWRSAHFGKLGKQELLLTKSVAVYWLKTNWVISKVLSQRFYLSWASSPSTHCFLVCCPSHSIHHLEEILESGGKFDRKNFENENALWSQESAQEAV